MTTFAEEVRNEVYGAGWGARRYLNDVIYIQMDIKDGAGRWVPRDGTRSLTNAAMYEATINP